MVKKLTVEDFILKSNEIHDFKYDYSMSIYINNKVKVEIVCPIHGSFLQIPNSHLSGHGCLDCKISLLTILHTKSTKNFIDEAKLMHEDFYDYSKVEYIDSRMEVEIICKIHGKFFQTPKIHLAGHGCSKCVGSVSRLETKWLDMLNIPLEGRGVSIRIGNKRMIVDGLNNNTIYEFYGDYWHGNPKIYSSDKLNTHNSKTFGELFSRTIQREQILKQSGYNLVSIWESDFKGQHA